MYSVLLVDDEPYAIEGLQMFVDWEHLGFRVCGVCENGVEALSAARELKPDVIVTDIRMPEMDGLELIGQLRGERGISIEFVVLSAYGEFAFAKRAMQLGVHQYLLKPVIGEEAAEVLNQIRMRLDVRRKFRQKASEGGEGKSLPALAAYRMKDVLEAIEDADRVRAADVIDSLFREMEGRSLEWAELFADSLIVQCGKLIRETGGDLALLLHSSQDPATYGADDGPTSSRMRILSFAKQVIDSVQLIRERKPGSIMTEVDRYVRENYRNPLSIRGMAARFYLNPVYLGKAYQDKFGCGLLDRMHDLRIAEACEKLRSTTETTSAVAEQVGYAHYRYFLQHFERRTGRKPAEYRDLKG
ncbi:response regulator transcription factor [Cohnella herbarum]|uniref:Response regulator n=1 Tax=Cohnella herbarum TaxID=2728023 RepID=A0A7Z2VJ25_9BACL|nr:response regulator [Cohnella herbarum]QJD84017.1 response regulator [Cohnella herbarum]